MIDRLLSYHENVVLYKPNRPMIALQLLFEIAVDFGCDLALNNPTPWSSILMKRNNEQLHLIDVCYWGGRTYDIRPKRTHTQKALCYVAPDRI
jgi:hypothetical protein